MRQPVKWDYSCPDLSEIKIYIERAMETSVGGVTEDFSDGGTYTW